MARLRSVRSAHAPNGRAVTATDRDRDPAADRGGDFLAAAFESAPDGLLVLDDERCCLDVNRAACALLGVPRAGLVGQRFDAFAPTGWRERVMAGWSAFLQDGLATGEFETDTPEGTRALVEYTAHARLAAGHHLWALHDVTAKRSAEVARRNLSAILDLSEDAICMCAHDGVLLSWNRGAETLYGYSAAEAIGQPMTMLVPDAQRAMQQLTWERAWAGEPVEPYETVRTTRDGRSVLVAVTVTAIADEFGTATGVGELARDVTDRTYAQATLPAAQAKAIEASELQTQFIASMNHELRVPLTGVIGISRLLDDTNLDAQQREYVQALRVSGEGLASAIEAVLDFSKLETGKLELSDEAYDLRTLVDEVCSVVGLGAASSEVEVLSYIGPDLPAILHGDEQRVRQVLMTLVGSAAKLTRAGDVVLRVSVVEHAVGARALVEVVAGSSIDAEQQQSVLEEITSANGPASRRPHGPGFGLTIAQRLTSLMGGEFGVDSVAGTGSSFRLALPIRKGAADPPTAPQAKLEDVHVLVVSPSDTSTQLVVAQLEDWNARVATADNHDAALQALRAAAYADDPFLVALIDHRDSKTSQLDATALARAIVSEEPLQRTRTVVLVAAGDMAAATAIQSDALMRRPVGQTRLYEQLARVIALPPRRPGTALPDTEQPDVPGSTGRVLVSEDNPVNRLVAVHLLEQRGFTVDTANDGREAIVMHAHHIYDAIFMDCQMPEISGYEATREIRRREGSKRRTPIIAMTASTLPSDRERCIAAGMDHHIGKPVRPTALDHVMARVLAARSGEPTAARPRRRNQRTSEAQHPLHNRDLSCGHDHPR